MERSSALRKMHKNLDVAKKNLKQILKLNRGDFFPTLVSKFELYSGESPPFLEEKERLVKL